MVDQEIPRETDEPTSWSKRNGRAYLLDRPLWGLTARF